MSRISLQVLATAIRKVRAMSQNQKLVLVEIMVKEQPNMFGSFLVQKQMGVSLEKIEFLLELLLICFQAMKDSGIRWPLITEDEQDKQLGRYVATVRFGEDLSSSLQAQIMKQYIDNHPEQPLLAFITAETTAWLNRIQPENADIYVILAAANFVNCIAFAAVPV